MNHVASKRSVKTPSTPRRRADVAALVALVSLDQDIARREGKVAASLALVDRARADVTSRHEKVAQTRDALQRMDRMGAKPPELEKQRRLLRDRERDLGRQMQMAEDAQSEAVAASDDLREQCADLPVRRAAIASRIPGARSKTTRARCAGGCCPRPSPRTGGSAGVASIACPAPSPLRSTKPGPSCAVPTASASSSTRTGSNEHE